MHLETLIQGLIVALDKNTAALIGGGSGKPVVGADQVVKPLAKDVEAKPAPKAEAPAAQPAAIDYEKDLKPLALALAKKDRAKLTAIWAELGVRVGTELKPEQFAQAKQLIEAASK